MNKERLTQLAEWLDAGAPHVVFDMGTGNEPVSDVLHSLEEEGDEDRYDAIIYENDKKGLGDCGTVCCIAGYAVQAFGTEEQKNKHYWINTMEDALDLLDLPRRHVSTHIGHALFDFALAPADCTPQQAAQAVRNCIANGGEGDPWEEVE